MRIKSTFKDYYDFVAHQYGGGDPMVVYPRTYIAEPETSQAWGKVIPDKVVEVEQSPTSDPYRLSNDENDVIRFLVVAGKGYILMAKNKPYGEKLQLSDFKVQPLDFEYHSTRHTWRSIRNWGFQPGVETERFILLSRAVGHPVFVINRVGHGWPGEPSKIWVDGQCPVLKDMGMPAFISPQQMYQDLAYFMGNLMRESPDVKPPVEVSNRDKILAAGFDLKQSFRHRV